MDCWTRFSSTSSPEEQWSQQHPPPSDYSPSSTAVGSTTKNGPYGGTTARMIPPPATTTQIHYAPPPLPPATSSGGARVRLFDDARVREHRHVERDRLVRDVLANQVRVTTSLQNPTSVSGFRNRYDKEVMELVSSMNVLELVGEASSSSPQACLGSGNTKDSGQGGSNEDTIGSTTKNGSNGGEMRTLKSPKQSSRTTVSAGLLNASAVPVPSSSSTLKVDEIRTRGIISTRYVNEIFRQLGYNDLSPELVARVIVQILDVEERGYFTLDKLLQFLHLVVESNTTRPSDSDGNGNSAESQNTSTMIAMDLARQLRSKLIHATRASGATKRRFRSTALEDREAFLFKPKKRSELSHLAEFLSDQCFFFGINSVGSQRDMWCVLN